MIKRTILTEAAIECDRGDGCDEGIEESTVIEEMDAIKRMAVFDRRGCN